MKITAEIVNGKCPTCEEFTMLVGLTKEIYRCMNCGSDLEQYVNGKIVYLPHITKRAEFDIAVKDWTEQWQKNLSHLKQEINLKKEAHVNTRKIKINQRKDSKNKHVIRAKERVDILPKNPTLQV